jgi:MFS family permease
VSSETLLRATAAILAFLLGGRMGRRAGAVLAGALAAFAVLGPIRPEFPGPAESAALAGGIALLLALGTRREFPSITEEASRAAAFAAGGAAAAALAAGRRLPGAEPFALAALAVLAVSAWAAESCRAGGEAGWREGLARALGVGVPAGLGAALSAVLASAGRTQGGWAVAGGLVAAVLVWAPAVLAESARVKAELAEEVRLGLLPPEDAEALRFPWTRRFEKRFGRVDERREYVRSALLLASARHQQRHRRGEAERLRQLEVLTFRTRLRRTQDARASRFQQSESGEFARETAPTDPPPAL